MSILIKGVILFGILVSFSLLGYLIYKLLIDCSTDGRFSKRHDIELIEAEQAKFATCIKCGERWEVGEVDEMIFIKREVRKHY